MKSPVGLLHSAGFYLHNAASTGERRTSKEVTTFPFHHVPSVGLFFSNLTISLSFDVSPNMNIELNWIQVAVTISTSKFLTRRLRLDFYFLLLCSSVLTSRCQWLSANVHHHLLQQNVEWKFLLRDQNISQSSPPSRGRVKGGAECIKATSSSCSVTILHLYLTVVPFVKVSVTDFKGQSSSETLHVEMKNHLYFLKSRTKRLLSPPAQWIKD